MIDRKEARRLLEALMDVNEQELATNSDETRKHNHEEALTLRYALEAANGTRDRRRRRILSTAAGLPPHRPVATTKDIDSIFKRSEKPAHVTGQRYSIARILLDELGVLLGGGPEDHEAATLILADMGYHGPQAKQDKATGIRVPTVRQGVNAADGASAAGRLSLYTVLGYTLGAEGKRDCPPSAWKQRAALHLRAIGPKPRPGPKPSRPPPFHVGLAEAERVVAAAWAYIEDESKDRSANDDREFPPRRLFRAGWRQGDAARRANCIDNSLTLRTK
jgi:hypothetical protein